jgi:hypothetical protein
VRREVPAAETRVDVESMHVLDRRCDALGHATITFFNTTDSFRWRKPDALVGVSSGVVCCTNYAEPNPTTEASRRRASLTTTLVRARRDAYRGEGTRVHAHPRRPLRSRSTRARTASTATCSRRARSARTRRRNGAVRQPDQDVRRETGIANLHLVGTDLLRTPRRRRRADVGVSMANRHALMPRARRCVNGQRTPLLQGQH